MKKIVVGILAHVDAGKTTMSEAMLYGSGTIQKLGRVDNKDAYLDTFELERQRGITIFSKQAVFTLGDTKITLVDTPGHVDFSPEMERTLQILDYAILIISAGDGVQGHTLTLWRLLSKYKIPVFLFVNKMDQSGTDANALFQELKEQIHDSCVDFSDMTTEEFYENAAMCEESLLEKYLETGKLEKSDIQRLIAERKLFPCFFGSALKFQGIEEFLEKLEEYTKKPQYGNEFGARVYKIARDQQGNRITYLKITGGSLKVKSVISYKNNTQDEKVNQIRIYSGEKYDVVPETFPGDVCAVTGLNNTSVGMGIGIEEGVTAPVLLPVLSYGIGLSEGYDAGKVLKKLREIEEEEPQLQIIWNEKSKEIQAKVMGEIQIQVLKTLIKERFDMDITFDTGSIVYKETITKTVEGVGHFEPLRHYAEVHLLLEPTEPGSGITVAAECSEDMLDRNWQHLVLTHLLEREHPGVRSGFPVTDIKITLVAGRSHLKHTEGGDFRQATYRAVRQGLMQADSILLEPVYQFQLELPEDMIGRAMTDIEKMHGSFELPEHLGELAVLKGQAPVSQMREYQKEVTAYTKGHGRLMVSPKGYAPCHNENEILESIGYDPERDVSNPTGSVFCAHGAGFTVPWYEVKEYMHLEGVSSKIQEYHDSSQPNIQVEYDQQHREEWLGTDEIDAILEKTNGANRKGKPRQKKGWEGRVTIAAPTLQPAVYVKKPKKESYLLVDGYNIIFAWDELKELAKDNIDGARGRLLDILSDYRGSTSEEIIAVFDAYRVEGHVTEISKYHNIYVVYTKQAETADQYIEKFAHENGKKYDVTIATSDGLEQIIIRGQGCRLYSARDFWEEVKRIKESNQRDYMEGKALGKVRLLDDISTEELSRFIQKDSEELEREK